MGKLLKRKIFREIQTKDEKLVNQIFNEVDANLIHLQREITKIRNGADLIEVGNLLYQVESNINRVRDLLDNQKSTVQTAITIEDDFGD